MRPLRIGLFTDTFLPDQNGIVTSVVLLADELAKHGHRVEILAPDFPDYQDLRTDVQRVSSIQYTFLPTYRLAWPTRKDFAGQYDIVHTHTPLTLGLAGARLAGKWKVPHVATYHTHLEAYTHYVPGLGTVDRVTRLVPRFIDRFYGKAAAVITPTLGTVQPLIEAGISNPVVIPTAVDPRVLEAAPDVPSPWPEGKHKLLTVGRLAREKRFDLVLDALAQLPDAHLVILGEGPERSALEAHAKALGVSERVTFLGVRPWTEIGAYYRLAELFLFASDSETQGLVLQEAQLMGVPVIAVGARGTLTGVEHGYSGYLVAPSDVGALVSHAQELLHSPERRAKFSAQAREFGNRLSPEGIARQVLDVYASTLDLPAGSLSTLAPDCADQLGAVASPRRNALLKAAAPLAHKLSSRISSK